MKFFKKEKLRKKMLQKRKNKVKKKVVLSPGEEIIHWGVNQLQNGISNLFNKFGMFANSNISESLLKLEKTEPMDSDLRPYKIDKFQFELLKKKKTCPIAMLISKFWLISSNMIAFEVNHPFINSSEFQIYSMSPDKIVGLKKQLTSGRCHFQAKH